MTMVEAVIISTISENILTEVLMTPVAAVAVAAAAVAAVPVAVQTRDQKCAPMYHVTLGRNKNAKSNELCA
ncbi:unnamed protein product [Gongylonema pulchrum]|uniref:Secreted protein n=1 Tax=Gongylonema pulchrum TaxID=637853 RepID=A0A183DKI4_9BILA|nr:unnamed protein product [Gongylonema pulchrum]